MTFRITSKSRRPARRPTESGLNISRLSALGGLVAVRRVGKEQPKGASVVSTTETVGSAPAAGTGGTVADMRAVIPLSARHSSVAGDLNGQLGQQQRGGTGMLHVLVQLAGIHHNVLATDVDRKPISAAWCRTAEPLAIVVIVRAVARTLEAAAVGAEVELAA